MFKRGQVLTVVYTRAGLSLHGIKVGDKVLSNCDQASGPKSYIYIRYYNSKEGVWRTVACYARRVRPEAMKRPQIPETVCVNGRIKHV